MNIECIMNICKCSPHNIPNSCFLWQYLAPGGRAMQRSVHRS